jgi:hypothetical protein
VVRVARRPGSGRAAVALVVGVDERDGGTIYNNTLLYYTAPRPATVEMALVNG